MEVLSQIERCIDRLEKNGSESHCAHHRVEARANFGDGEDSPQGSRQMQGTKPWRNPELPLFNGEKEDVAGEEATMAKVEAAL